MNSESRITIKIIIIKTLATIISYHSIGPTTYWFGTLEPKKERSLVVNDIHLFHGLLAFCLWRLRNKQMTAKLPAWLPFSRCLEHRFGHNKQSTEQENWQ